MQIIARHDFNRPRAKVLTRFRDPERVESVLGSLCDDLSRTANPPRAAWTGTVTWRGTARPLTLTLHESLPDTAMELTMKADIADAIVVFHFADLPDGGCRVTAEATPVAHSLMARMAVASMGLVKGKLSRRLAKLVAALGKP